jgi:hypothetical protein
MPPLADLKLHEEVLRLPGLPGALRLLRPPSVDALLERLDPAAPGADARIPYWAELWPSSLALAAWLLRGAAPGALDPRSGWAAAWAWSASSPCAWVGISSWLTATPTACAPRPAEPRPQRARPAAGAPDRLERGAAGSLPHPARCGHPLRARLRRAAGALPRRRAGAGRARLHRRAGPRSGHALPGSPRRGLQPAQLGPAGAARRTPAGPALDRPCVCAPGPATG